MCLRLRGLGVVTLVPIDADAGRGSSSGARVIATGGAATAEATVRLLAIARLGAGWSAAPARHRCRGTRPTRPSPRPAPRRPRRRPSFGASCSGKPQAGAASAPGPPGSRAGRKPPAVAPTVAPQPRRPRRRGSAFAGPPRRRASTFARRPPRTPPPTRARRPAAVPHLRAGAGKFPAQPAEEGPDRRTAWVRRAGPARRGARPRRTPARARPRVRPRSVRSRLPRRRESRDRARFIRRPVKKGRAVPGQRQDPVG